MRCDLALGVLGALGFALVQAAMAFGHCATMVPSEAHHAHQSTGQDVPEPEEPADDGIKGCHACLRKRALPIKG